MNPISEIDRTARVSRLFMAAALSLAGIAVALYQGHNPDLDAIAQLLTELASATTAGIVVRWAVDKIKGQFPNISPVNRYRIAMALSGTISPLAYLVLVVLGLTPLTEHGAILAVTAAFATATTIHKEMQNKTENIGEQPG